MQLLTALNDFAYNFIKIHLSLRMSPTMAAGVTDRFRDAIDPAASGSRMSNGGR